MRTILLFVALLFVGADCFASGSYDGYITYKYEPPPYIKTDTYMGGSGMKYFKYGDFISINTPSGMSTTYEVHEYRVLYGNATAPGRRVWICVNEDCNNEFYRRRLAPVYTLPRH